MTAQARVNFKEFLERASIGDSAVVSDALLHKPAPGARALASSSSGKTILAMPDLSFFCPTEACQREMRFHARFESERAIYRPEFLFLTYWCRNCGLTSKTFALHIAPVEGELAGPATVLKYGDHPSLDERLSGKLLKLVGEDRELFLKGFRAERAGLGIGAFGYYRRVVENQKAQIFDAIGDAAKTLGHVELVGDIERAKKETQFSKAVEQIKHAIPESLLVGGHDPLKVLYHALSEGLHSKEDSHCLDYAETVREVLGGLAERVARATRDEESLRSAIGRLMREA